MFENGTVATIIIVFYNKEFGISLQESKEKSKKGLIILQHYKTFTSKLIFHEITIINTQT
jgi:hypothetical protein